MSEPASEASEHHNKPFLSASLSSLFKKHVSVSIGCTLQHFEAFPATVTLAGVSFPSLEHYWQAAPFIGQEDALVRSIAAAATVDEAMILAGGAGLNAQRSDFRERRLELLAEGLKAKAAQCPAFVQALQATGEKTLVFADTDPWAGMQAPGGLATGQNAVGKALMELRSHLRSA
eukprot:s1214_g16.t1